MIGDKIPNYGRNHTSDTEKNISEPKIRSCNGWTGRSHTEQSKNKISESNTGTAIYGENPRAVKVICIHNGLIFDCAKEAGIYGGSTNIKNYGSSVRGCCSGKRNYAGKHPETGEKLEWMYLEDYLDLTKTKWYIYTYYNVGVFIWVSFSDSMIWI